MSLDSNGDDILSLYKKLADWDRRNEALLEYVSSLPEDESHISRWWSALTEAERLSAEGFELFETLFELFRALLAKMDFVTGLLYKRENWANGLINEIQMVSEANSSRNRDRDCIDTGIPEPYPIEMLRKFVDEWKEQDAQVREVKKEIRWMDAAEAQKRIE